MSHYDDMCSQLRDMGYDVDVSTLEEIDKFLFTVSSELNKNPLCFRVFPNLSNLYYQTPQCDERFIR